MGFFTFIGELLGGKAEAPAAAPNAPSRALASAQAAAVPVVDDKKSVGLTVADDSRVFESEPGMILFREAIMDTRNRLCGYRFLLRSVMQQSVQAVHHFDDRDTLFFKLLQGSDIPDFAARRMAVIPVHLDSLTSGRYRFLAAPHSVFQIDLALIQSNFDEVIVHLQEARRQGCQIAMTGFSIAQHTPQLLKATDLLFLKMSDYSLLELQGLLTKLKTAVPALGVVVEGVPTWAEQRMCLALGVKYCLGDFVSSVDREEVQEGMMAPGRIISIEMLNLLRREAELGELSQVAKKDPGITLQLLKWANSPMAGLRNPVTSMDQAIMVLGRETLYRWLTMSIFRMGKEHKERDESLLEVALTRARFLETVASPDLPRESRDELFLVGMLSLFEVLLSMPMEKILAQMTLPESVSDVLLRSSGPYGRYLRLAMVMERGRSGQIADLAQTLGISVEDVQSTNLSAFNWAQEALAGENASTRTLQ